MKTYVIDGTHDSGLQTLEKPRPKPRRRQVLIKVRAASLNPHDWKYLDFIKPLYQFGFPLPKITLGHDVAGDVVETGEGVKSLAVGDAVLSMSAKTGAFSEYITIDERMVARKPANLSYAESATLPMAGLTALQALMLANLKPGDSLLIIGGSGGVGVHAIQIAKSRGAMVTAVCSTRNVPFVAELGADHVVDYTKDDYLNNGLKYNVVFDTVGNATLKQCAHILQDKGQFVTTLPTLKNLYEIAESSVARLFHPHKAKASTLLALPVKRHLEKIVTLSENSQLVPHIDKTFSFEQLASSISYSKLGRTKGKIAITIFDEATQE